MEKEWISGKKLAERWGLEDQEMFDLVKEMKTEKEVPKPRQKYDGFYRTSYEDIPRAQYKTIIEPVTEVTYNLQPYYPTKNKCDFKNVMPTKEEMELLRESVKNAPAPWIYNVRWIFKLYFKMDEVKEYEAEHSEILEKKIQIKEEKMFEEITERFKSLGHGQKPAVRRRLGTYLEYLIALDECVGDPKDHVMKIMSIDKDQYRDFVAEGRTIFRWMKKNQLRLKDAGEKNKYGMNKKQ